MKIIRSLNLFLIIATLLALTSAAHAQATRTWVSGTGDDANPCSRIAPCKTFAGAISKTATNGEINAIDAGGFGNLTIIKSINVVGDESLSGILAAGTYGLTVNVAASDKVFIRNIDIEGDGTGTFGIRIIGGGTVIVENCRINNFSAGTSNGIDFQPSIAGAKLIVHNCTITNNSIGSGVLVKPNGVTAHAIVSDTRLSNNNGGLRVEANGIVSATRVHASGNLFAGFNVLAGGLLNLSSCTSSQNMWGLRANGGTIRVTDTTVASNSADGFLVLVGGQIQSFGDNKVSGNSPDGNATSMLGYH